MFEWAMRHPWMTLIVALVLLAVVDNLGCTFINAVHEARMMREYRRLVERAPWRPRPAPPKPTRDVDLSKKNGDMT